MPKRVLNIYLYRDGDNFMLRMIDMNDLMEVPANANLLEIGLMANDMITKTPSICFALLNRLNLMHKTGNPDLPIHEIINAEVGNNFLNVEQNGVEHIYFYQDMQITLPQDATSLLKILIGLDPTIIHMLHDEKIKVYYQTEIPDFLNRHQILEQAFASDLNQQLAPKKLPASHVLTWLIAHLTDESLKHSLQPFLELDQTSVTHAIYQALYPAPTMQSWVKEHCPQDEVLSDLFNPVVPHAQARLKLLNYARVQLKNNQKDALNAWFENHAILRQQLWEKLISKVYGMPAPDKGLYMPSYTEISLLKESTLSVNAQGLVELDFKNSESFAENYAASKQWLYSDLENELRAVCDLMGLHFSQDQDFHSGCVTFDMQSSQLLKDHDLHITRDYCKSLLRASHLFRFFNSSGNDGAVVFEPLPANCRALIASQVEPNLPTNELQEMARNPIPL